jgi:hypothetical protein
LADIVSAPGQGCVRVTEYIVSSLLTESTDNRLISENILLQ